MSLCEMAQICLWGEVTCRHMVFGVMMIAIVLWGWRLAEMGLVCEEWDSLREVAYRGRHIMGCRGCGSRLEHYRWDWMKRSW